MTKTEYLMAQPLWSEKNHMIRLDGSKRSFRCECGCNVFKRHKHGPRFKCNSCEATYTGVEDESARGGKQG